MSRNANGHVIKKFSWFEYEHYSYHRNSDLYTYPLSEESNPSVCHLGDSGFYPRPLHVRVILEKVAVEWAYLWVLPFSPVSTIPPGSAPWLGTLRDMKEWIKYWLWKRNLSLRRGPVGGTLRGGGRGPLYRGLWEKGEILIYKETLFIVESERYVKSLWKRATLSIIAPLRNVEDSSFTGDFEGQ